MKRFYLLLSIMVAGGYTAVSQNLYTIANAANPDNEANATTGWTGAAAITSSTTNPQNGTYALLVTSTGTGRDARYTFTATIGTVYTITINARRGATFNNPAFANWTGFSGFTTTAIGSQTWTQYSWTLTATGTNPVIVAYAAPIGAAAGPEIYIDNITITALTGGDTQAPTAPNGLAASNTTVSSTTLTWNASTDNTGVTQYQIRRDNVLTGTVAGNILTFNASGLTMSTTYSFNVVALDAANNVSQPSNTIQVTTLAGGGDTEPPTTPSNLTAANVTSTSLTLNWTASTDNIGVTNYEIYRNNSLFGQTGNSGNTYNAAGLSPSTAYSFHIIARDAAGNSSNQSNTLNVTTAASGSGEPFTTLNANLPTVNWQANNLFVAGNAGIGTAPNSNFRLSVNGDVRAKEVVVETGWSDFVFHDDYYLPPLSEVEQFIKKNGHLQDIPPASEVMENGVGLAGINTRLLQKIEELTLYMIELNKQIELLEAARSADSTGVATSPKAVTSGNEIETDNLNGYRTYEAADNQKEHSN